MTPTDRLNLAAADPNPGTEQLLAYEQETTRLLREKGMRVEAERDRLAEFARWAQAQFHVLGCDEGYENASDALGEEQS